MRLGVALDEDTDLKLITARKLAEMKKMMAHTGETKADKSNKEVVLSVLNDRGDEVLEAAYAAYPIQTQQIVDELAKLIREKKLVDGVPGGELLALFRNLGLRFNVKTSIKVQERGRLVDLADKLRGEKD
jgi:hypothetical protein